MRVKLGALVAGVCALTIGLAGPVSAGNPTLQMTVNPTSGLAGSTFTVTGTNCLGIQFGGNHNVHVTVVVAFEPEAQTQTISNPPNPWTMTFTVPPGQAVGPYPVTGTCNDDGVISSSDASAVALLSGRPRTVPLQVAAALPYPAGTFTVLAASTPAAPAVSDPAAAVASAPRTTG
jgi:hypothetical protein